MAFQHILDVGKTLVLLDLSVTQALSKLISNDY